jgi:hypothetical protein
MPAQVFDVSRSTPKQLSVGRFEDPKTGASLGDVRSLRCNCDGTRVSLLASKRISERSRSVCMCVTIAIARGEGGRVLGAV